MHTTTKKHKLTNPVRFQHPVAGTYKKWCNENNRKYFSVASGGGTSPILSADSAGLFAPDLIATAAPSSYA